MDNAKVFCKNCARFYSTGADQCDIPNVGITALAIKRGLDKSTESSELNKKEIRFNQAVYGDCLDNLTEEDIEKANFFLERSKPVHMTNNKLLSIYGHPSELNYDNTCKFYSPDDKMKEAENKFSFSKFFKFKK